jgi:uncharacterized protein YqhQ
MSPPGTGEVGANAAPIAGSGNGASPPLRLGGMALRNGLLIHGPTAWAAAVRSPDGRIEVASGPKPSFAGSRLGRAPILRGPLRLGEAMAVVPLVRVRLRSARLPFEDPRVLAIGLAASIASGVLRRLDRSEETSGEAALREGLIGALGLLPALAALRDRDLAAYHGVEHKAIGAYEQGLPDPAQVPKEHRRCGSNLIGPMLALSVAGQVVVHRLIDEPGPLARGLAGLAGVSVAVEMFAYAERHPGSALGRAVHVPGHEIQRLLSTREPTPEQLEVGVAALEAILREEAASGRDRAGGRAQPAEGAVS